MIGTGYVALMAEIRNAYNILVEKPEAKRRLERSRRRREDNITVDLREIGWENRDQCGLLLTR
jgi:hypothetical protein